MPIKNIAVSVSTDTVTSLNTMRYAVVLARTFQTRIFAFYVTDEKSLRDLERQRKKLQGDLRRLAGRGDLAWTEVKKGFKAAAKDVDRAVKIAVADFRKIP